MSEALDRIEGISRDIRHAKGLVSRAARTDLTVLFSGETGTGKELFARALHALSDRRDGPFVALNCAAVPPDLFEAELFGYEPGAFTGASRTGKPGRFELAEGGTLLLDEVGELPNALQAKLLRVLQERAVERVGGTRGRAVDVRVVAATNRDLRAAVSAGTFRDDLFYRLAVITIHLPPLRERPEDIAPIAATVLEVLARERGEAPRRLSPEALAMLRSYRWPGNVRELENFLRRAVTLSDGPTIDAEAVRTHLQDPDGWAHAEVGYPPKGRTGGPEASLIGAEAVEAILSGRRTLSDVLEAVEEHLIRQVLAATGENRSRSARLLGLPRSSLYEKLSKHGLTG